MIFDIQKSASVIQVRLRRISYITLNIQIIINIYPLYMFTCNQLYYQKNLKSLLD